MGRHAAFWFVGLGGCANLTGIGDVKDDDDVVVDTDVVDTDLPPDTDLAPDTDLPPPACIAYAEVDHRGGTALVDFPVRVTVASFTGLAADLSNLVVRDEDQNVLPHWVSDAAAGLVWVKLASMAPGVNVLSFDACDPTVSDLGSVDDIYLVTESFDDPASHGWAGACENNEAYDESCTTEIETQGATTALRTTTVSSCYVSPYNGTHAVYTRPLDLPAGSWQLSMRAWLTGSHDEFCSGATGVAARAQIGADTVAEATCSLSACSTCDLGAQTLTSPPFAGQRSTTLTLRTQSGDCASASALYDNVGILQVTDPAPVVTWLGVPTP